MSGGSFNYLYSNDAVDILNSLDDLERMSELLSELGYAEDAARETEELLCILRQFRVRFDVRLKQLAPIWKAVEYWKSNDWSEASVKEELAKYRNDIEG